jgi:hypothetical protein
MLLAADSVPSMSRTQEPTVVLPNSFHDFVVFADGVGP